MGLIQIPFEDDMWEECRRVAAGRSSPKRGWFDRLSGGPPSDESHFLGVVGEAAVSLFFGVRLNREFHNGDRHAPDVVTGGIGIEVKTSKYAPPHLKFNDMKEFPTSSNIAVMVHADSDKRVATLWGWIDRRRFAEDAEVRNYGYGRRLVMTPPFNDMYELYGVHYQGPRSPL
jgi:hypothetical protein